MEPVFLGIKFRGIHHRDWFVFTMTVFFASIIVSLSCIWLGLYLPPLCIWSILGILNAVTALDAIKYTQWGKDNGPTYSIDCIWYNGAFAIIYFLAAAVCVPFL